VTAAHDGVGVVADGGFVLAGLEELVALFFEFLRIERRHGPNIFIVRFARAII
jgi:hypothetical protein